jgi:hypothetical protein
MTLGTQPWAEPVLEWRAPRDYAALQDRLQRDAELLTTWPVAPSEAFPTDCYRLGEQYWISQRSVGAVQFTALDPHLFAYPFPDGDASWFREVVQRAWLPAIYPFWGRRVIHASAAGPSDTNDVIAFTGPTLAGKSTTACAMGRRPGWRLISDDTLRRSLPLRATAFGCTRFAQRAAPAGERRVLQEDRRRVRTGRVAIRPLVAARRLCSRRRRRPPRAPLISRSSAWLKAAAPAATGLCTFVRDPQVLRS